MLDDSPNYSEIKMTIIYQKKGFICMSFQNLVAAYFTDDDDDAPWSDLGWMSCGFQAGFRSDSQLWNPGDLASLDLRSLTGKQEGLAWLRSGILNQPSWPHNWSSSLTCQRQSCCSSPSPRLVLTPHLEKLFSSVEVSGFTEIKKEVCSWNNYGSLAQKISKVLHNEH